MNVTERELAAQTLADFERDGFGHWLDNADADVLRAMVRLSIDRHRGAVARADALEAAIRQSFREAGSPVNFARETLQRAVGDLPPLRGQ